MEKYQIIKPIGKGSYGDVFLVRHLVDRKQYVLKKIFIKKSSKEKVLAQQEVKLLSELHHPNIVEYKDSFLTEKGQYMCIVMAYCEGGDLFTRLKAQNKKYLPEKQIIDWFVQIALALHYLHQRKVLHRDLKTQNTFLTKNGIIKLGDFGIARVMENSMDMAKTMIGTPYYMSPELFDNKPYNYKSDVWSLGCCVYEMTALRHAFDAKEMPTLIMKILKENPSPIPPHFSSDLSALIRLMLTKSPTQRPSIADLLQLPFIKAHMQASVMDHKEKVHDPAPPVPPVGPSAGPSAVNAKRPSDPATPPSHPAPPSSHVRVRNKIAEELSNEEEVQKKLELKLKKLEADLKSDRARGDKAIKPPEKKQIGRVEDKQPAKVHVVGSKLHPEAPQPRLANKNEPVKKRDDSKIKKEVATPRSQEGKKDSVPTPRPASAKSKESLIPKPRLASPSSRDKTSQKKVVSQIPSPRVPAPKNAEFDPVKNHPVPDVGENNKMDDLAAKTEKDFFAARIASLQTKNGPSNADKPTRMNKPEKPDKPDKPIETKPKAQISEDGEEFPVVQCSHNSNDDVLEEDEEFTKLAAQLRESTIKIKKINNELYNIDQAERDMEMEEVISIYDSVVKNGVSDIPEDDDGPPEEVFMTGNLSDRINALRQNCKEGLGEQLFEKVYGLMKSGDGNDEESLETYIENLIGGSKMIYFNYIRQIIFCEHSLQ